MGKSSPPKPPNPQQTAAAQTQSNVSTAIANAGLGNVNQVTPTGNLTYQQTGQQFIVDKNGSVRRNGGTGALGYYVPTYTATQSLTPGQQRIFNDTQGAQQNLAALGRDQSKRLQDMFATPFSIDGAPQVDSGMAARDKAEAALMARLQPYLDQQDQKLRANLYNSGNMAGGRAYNDAVDESRRAENDARLATIAQAGQEQQLQHSMSADDRNRYIQEQLLQRQTPLNETMALLGGSQVQPWSYVPTNMPQIPTTDTAGIINQNYNQRMGAYNSQMNQYNQMMGGLFSLGAAGIGAW